ncbi:MAG TPA: mannose-1-phosphate guanylyltransferase/mannose-6-phosphate isomerase [Candidatus Moranbacteria bacterium]|nr:mannose-1-phosphate guanylyltransferase/mannose-6-phosphate isomerase [Candidatus Moranbacteria bacterium]
MYALILCGGSGTRLWPLSRKNFPKQFLKLYSDKSLLQETFLRAAKLVKSANVVLVTNQENYFNVLNQVKEVEPAFSERQIVIEPSSLNTAPAIMLGVKYLTEKLGSSKDAPIIMLPADHYIGKEKEFLRVAKNALQNVGSFIGTIGIKPTEPHVGYGYIKKGKKEGKYWLVEAFKEKPDLATAKKYLADGQYLWNSGMYLFSAKVFARELKKHAPALYAAYEKKLARLQADFAQLEASPIDIAISEKSDKVVMFEGDFGWNDIGSFDALADVAKENGQADSRHVFIDSNNVYVHSTTNRLVATLGVDDLQIVENNDCILVAKRGRSDEVKKVVEHLKTHGYPEIEHNVEVYRPWGKYEVLIDEKNHKVKKITVYPGAKLSLQSHERRAEHWVVVKGTAQVVNGENLLVLHENESTYIPAKAKHRLSNPGKVNLEIIEVQTGEYLEEDDIVRYEDTYGRG